MTYPSRLIWSAAAVCRSMSGRAAVTAFLGAVSGCASRHSSESALNPAGPQAERIAHLFWLFLGVSVVVWILVMLFLFGALRLRHRQTAPANEIAPDLAPDARRERRLSTVVGTSTGLTILILLVLLVSEFTTARAAHRFGETATDQISIQITGHQWWWDVQYKDASASQWFTTANELVLPVGRKVSIELQSADVIHSFWVPSLHGKKDLVPGHPSILWLEADRPGTYWGECAEYCGYQHAQMRLIVKVLPQAEFDAWLAASRESSKSPQTDAERRGQAVFMSSSCVMCHRVGGTRAFGRFGPDLTHFGSRSTIAAGARLNTPGNLAGWIADPQGIKPGTNMPQNQIPPEDLRALVDYLESLK